MKFGGIIPILLFGQAQIVLDHLCVFQEDKKKDGFHRPGMGHVDPGTDRHFGPVKKPVKCFLLLIFLRPAGIP